MEQREKSKLEADKEKGKVRGRMGEKERKKGTAIVGKHRLKEMGLFSGRKFEDCVSERMMKGIHLPVQALKSPLEPLESSGSLHVCLTGRRRRRCSKLVTT